MLRALVIVPNSRTKEISDLLAVARAEAKKREHAKHRLPIRSVIFVPELDVYIAVYEVKGVQKPGVGR